VSACFWRGKRKDDHHRDDVSELGFGQREDHHRFCVGEKDSVLLAEPELDPQAQRHVEGRHDLGCDAFVDEVVVGDPHEFHRSSIALETPKLRQVEPEVCQGGGRGNPCLRTYHVDDVLYLFFPETKNSTKLYTRCSLLLRKYPVSWTLVAGGEARSQTSAEHAVVALYPHSSDQRSCFCGSSRDGASNEA